MKLMILMRCSAKACHPFSQINKDNISFFPSYYGELGEEPSADTPYFHHYKGGKWSGIYDFFVNFPELLREFDYFWFVDDDILADIEVVSKFFEIVSAHGFALAQPALTSQSYWAHRITLQNEGFIFRNSNLVELMMPVMKRDFLEKVLPLFKGRDAAMGVDFMWHQLTENPQRDVAIIDATPMTHSRPRQMFLKSAMKQQDRDIYRERSETCNALSIRRQMPVVLGGLTVAGKYYKRGPSLLPKLLIELSKIAKEARNPALSLRDYFNLVVQQIFGRSNRLTFDRDAYLEIAKNNQIDGL
nr:hypothetical protein [uncultured Cohaesibacter sp.]